MHTRGSRAHYAVLIIVLKPFTLGEILANPVRMMIATIQVMAGFSPIIVTADSALNASSDVPAVARLASR